MLADVPNDVWIVAAALLSAAMLVGLVTVRVLSKGNVEVRLTDAAIAIVPLLVALFATDKITKLALGPEGVTFERAGEAILAATRRSVDEQVAPLPVVQPKSAEKGPVSALDRHVAEGLEALTFQFGLLYDAGVTEEYVRTLTEKTPKFRYVVFTESNGETFAGIIDPRHLLLAADADGFWRTFVDRLRAGDKSFFEQLSGFVTAAQAITEDSSKREALQRMEAVNADWLPVRAKDGRLAGIIERSRLTASLILDVAARLEQPSR